MIHSFAQKQRAAKSDSFFRSTNKERLRTICSFAQKKEWLRAICSCAQKRERFTLLLFTKRVKKRKRMNHSFFQKYEQYPCFLPLTYDLEFSLFKEPIALFKEQIALFKERIALFKE